MLTLTKHKFGSEVGSCFEFFAVQHLQLYRSTSEYHDMHEELRETGKEHLKQSSALLDT